MSRSRVLLMLLVSQLSATLVAAEWNCPPESKFCFQLLNSSAITWDAARGKCNEIGAELPRAEHLNERNTYLKRGNIGPFWTSLCFSQGRLQWMGINPYEERHLPFFDKLLPDLTSRSIIPDQLYCFYAASAWPDDAFGDFKLAMKIAHQESRGVCAAERRNLHRLAAPPANGKIVSVSITSIGNDADPVAQQREGYVSLPRSKHKSIKLKCNARTSDSHTILNYNWLRNDGYIGVNAQEIGFLSEEDLMSWIGSITCEATTGTLEPIRSQAVQLTLWDTVTIRLTTNCVTCQLQGVVEASKIILTQFVENEIRPGAGQEIEFYNEPPVINQTSISFNIHLRNKRIEKFDYKLGQKLGHQFDLSGWAKRRSLLLPNGSDLRVALVSPCNLALAQDRQNVTWIGYLGQTVSSGNIVDGPVCVNRRGDVITRSCGRPASMRYEECAAVKSRQEEPICFPGFEYVDGRCWRMTQESNFASALGQCSAGRQFTQQYSAQESVNDWIQNAIRWFSRNRLADSVLPVVWMPLRRFGRESRPIAWNWKSGSNRWLLGDAWNATDELGSSSDEKSCAAFNLETKQLVFESCQKEFPAICARPPLPQPISVITRNQEIGEYFCPPGWITHPFTMDMNVCYRQLTLREPVTWDEAEKICVTHGGNLATAPTHYLRIVLEHVHAFYSNLNETESWIGLRSQNGRTGEFTWLNGERGETYNWDAYNDFGEAYGVSVGNKWKSWPRSTRLNGVVCEQTVPNWRDGLRLRLEPSTGQVREGNYSLVFTYDPAPMHGTDEPRPFEATFERIELPNMSKNFVKKFFWQSDVDVACYFSSEVLHFRIPAGHHRRYETSLNVPDNVEPSSLTCEAWLNSPVVRFQSNTIVHRPANVFTFVLIVARQNSGLTRSPTFVNRLEANEDELRRRLSLNGQSRILRDVISRSSITSTVKSELTYGIQLINYKLSFFLPPNVHVMDLQTDIRGCQKGPAEMYIPNQYSATDFEPLLHLLLKSCLPSIYKSGETYQLIEVRSTVACPAESPLALPDQMQHSNLHVHHLSWPRTSIGQIAKPQQLCMVDNHLVRRSCQGNFESGATWGPAEVPELNEIVDESKQCHDPDAEAAKLNALERAARSTDPEAILDELLSDWKNKQGNIIKLEKTIAILKQLLNEAARGSRISDKIAAIIEKMIYPGASPLEELQLQPAALNNLMDLLSELALLEMRANRAARRFGKEVTVAAERTDFGVASWRTPQPATVLDVDRAAVNITKDFGNFGNKPSVTALAASLPPALLTLDPVTKTRIVKIHKSDASDPRHAIVLGAYIADSASVRVELRTEPKTTHLTSPLTLTFRAAEQEANEEDVLCARWETRPSWTKQGGWLTDGCWYLGRDLSGSHVCQCNSPGIFGVFHPEQAYFAKLRSAFAHRLPIIVSVALFAAVFVTAIVRACFVFRQAVQEMDLVEMGVRLEMMAAWTGMLVFSFAQTFLSGNSMGCVVLTTMTQFFLLAAFMWLCMLPILRYWHIHERWIRCQGIFLVKTSFAIWSLASIVVITVPLYKIRFLGTNLNFGCWLEHDGDFELSLAAVIAGLLISLVLQLKNSLDQRNLLQQTFTMSDGLSLLHTLLVGAAGLLAVTNNSWYHSLPIAITFGIASGLLGVWWIIEFWLQVPSPVEKHDFSDNTRKLSFDLHLKKDYGTSVEYLSSH